MKRILRAIYMAMPLSGIGSGAIAGGITERVGEVASDLHGVGKANGVIGAVSLIIDSKKTYDDVGKLNEYNSIKAVGVPTYSQAAKAIESTRMIGTFGGEEFVEPVKETASKMARQEIDSANFQKCFISNSNSCMSSVGSQIDATTKAVNQRNNQEWSSAGMIQQSIPGAAGDSWNIVSSIGNYVSEKFPGATNYLLEKVYPSKDSNWSSNNEAFKSKRSGVGVGDNGIMQYDFMPSSSDKIALPSVMKTVASDNPRPRPAFQPYIPPASAAYVSENKEQARARDNLASRRGELIGRVDAQTGNSFGQQLLNSALQGAWNGAAEALAGGGRRSVDYSTPSPVSSDLGTSSSSSSGGGYEADECSASSQIASMQRSRSADGYYPVNYACPNPISPSEAGLK